MQEGKVIIANGSPETRARLTNFKSQMKLKDPLKKITMGAAIDFAIAQAERVPELEKENLELKERIKELTKPIYIDPISLETPHYPLREPHKTNGFQKNYSFH